MTEYKQTFKAILIFALPIILSNLINAASSLISMFLVAQISANALAAGALITSTYGLLIMMVMSFLYSVSIMIGQSIGRGCDGEVGRILSSGLLWALIIGIPLNIAFLNVTPILQWLHQPQTLSILAGKYFHGVAYGLIPSLMGAVLSQFFLGVGKARITLYLTILGVLFNSIGSYVLIFGYGPIKPLGVFGAGLASSITAFMLLTVIVIYLAFSADCKRYSIQPSRLLSLGYGKVLAQIGFPISMQYTLELLAFAAITYLMGIISVESLAAQQIIMQCSMLSIMVIMGLSQASAVLISHNLRENSPLDKTTICKTTLIFGALIMLIVGLLYCLLSEKIISFYVDIQNPSHDALILTAKSFLIIAAFTQFFDAGRNIAAGLLRGYGDTRTSMWTGLVSCWLVGMPLALIFAFSFGFGGLGLRLGILVGIVYGCLKLIRKLTLINQTHHFLPQYNVIGEAS